MAIIGGSGDKSLGLSGSSSLIFPRLWSHPLRTPPSIQYRLGDGMFYDGTNYYYQLASDEDLREDKTLLTPRCQTLGYILSSS
jgi:hypothetical protein